MLFIALLSIGCSHVYAGGANVLKALRLESEAGSLKTHWNGDAIRRSISFYNLASKEWRKDRNQTREAFCLRESVRLNFLVSPTDETISNAKSALRLSEKLGDADGTVDALGLITRINLNLGQFQTADKYLKRALKESRNSRSDRVKAEINLIAGIVYLEYTRNHDALIHLEIAEQLAGSIGDIELHASILLNLGITRAISGENEKARSLLNKALVLWNKKDDKRGLARIYNAIGFVDSISNKKQAALANYSNAANLIPDDVDYLEQAKSANGLASVFSNYGQMDLAGAAHERALAAYRKAGNFIGQAATLPDIAEHAYRNGEYEKSRNLLDEAVELAEKAGHDYFKAIAKQTLGDIELDRGNTRGAIALFNETLPVFTRNENYLAVIKNKLGAAYEKSGNTLKARALFNSAALKNRHTRDTVQLADNMFNLARNSFNAGHIDLAFGEIKESILITESLYHDVNNGKLRQSFLSDTFDRYNLLIRVLMAKHKRFPNEGFEIQALQASEKGRSRKMLENVRLSRSDMRADARPELVKQETELSSRLSRLKQKMTELIGKKSAQGEIEKIELEISHVDFQLKEVLASIERYSPIYSAITTAQELDVDAFRKSLDSQTLVVEFALGDEESFVWVIDRSAVKVFTLPGRDEIERRTIMLRELISSREKLESESVKDFQFRMLNKKAMFEQKARELSDTLFGQFADKLGNKRLVIIADGKLSFFPFSAFPVPSRISKSRVYVPLLLSNEIVYQPSATLAFVMSSQQTPDRGAGKDLLVFTDAVYSAEDPRIEKKRGSSRMSFGTSIGDSDFDDQIKDQLGSLRRLSGTGPEADSITSYFGSERFKIASGFDANRSAFLNTALDEFKILHFATHSVLNEDHPELSGLVFSRIRSDGNPIDGFVRLSDIYRKRLQADLVILSACDTGVGKEVRGEGVMSLSNGFLQIGASTVVSSSWKVDDRATLQLMRAFYEELVNHDVTPSVALRQAQIELLKSDQYSSPHFWATFASHGDYLKKPRFSKGFNSKGYVLLAGLLLMGFAGLAGFRIFRYYRDWEM